MDSVIKPHAFSIKNGYQIQVNLNMSFPIHFIDFIHHYLDISQYQSLYLAVVFRVGVASELGLCPIGRQTPLVCLILLLQICMRSCPIHHQLFRLVSFIHCLGKTNCTPQLTLSSHHHWETQDSVVLILVLSVKGVWQVRHFPSWNISIGICSPPCSPAASVEIVIAREEGHHSSPIFMTPFHSSPSHTCD